MKTKILKKTSIFPVTENEVFDLLKQLNTLQYIAKPYAAFTPVNEIQELTWTEGATFSFSLKLFCCIPFGIHTIKVIQFSDDTHEIYTNESNINVPIWNHRILLRSIKDGKTAYTDEVEIGAGWKTMFVYIWAKCFYSHRQRKWKKLLKGLS